MEEGSASPAGSGSRAGSPAGEGMFAAPVMRPVARRVGPIPGTLANSTDASASLNASSLPSFSSAPAASLSAMPPERKSAWAKYQSAPPSNSPSPTTTATNPICPPKSSNEAHQQAAQRLWEAHAAADSSDTNSASPPPSPNEITPRSPLAEAPAPPNPLHLLAAYSASLKAQMAQQQQQQPVDFAPGRYSGKARRPSTIQLQQAQAMLDSLASQVPGFQGVPPQGSARRVKQEQPCVANGSLSIMPPMSTPIPPAPATPPQIPQALPQALNGFSASSLAHIAHLSQQLEDLLRSQALMQQQQGAVPSTSLQMLSAEPPMYGAHASMPPPAPPSTSYQTFGRYPNHEGWTADAHFPQHSVEVDNKGHPLMSDHAAVLAFRRWNSMGSQASASSLAAFGGDHEASCAAAPLNPSAVAGLGPDIGALNSAMLMLYQANELAAVANSRIQAFSVAASAKLEMAAPGYRKRKAHELDFQDAPKRHHSAIGLEPDNYQGFAANGHQQQMCTDCGTTSTPTWRRSGKRLMCNACGLRRSRSLRSQGARSNSVPLAAHTPAAHAAATQAMQEAAAPRLPQAAD